MCRVTVARFVVVGLIALTATAWSVRVARACSARLPLANVSAPDYGTTCGTPPVVESAVQRTRMDGTSCSGMRWIHVRVDCADCVVVASMTLDGQRVPYARGAALQVEDHLLLLPEDEYVTELALARVDPVRGCVSPSTVVAVSQGPYVGSGRPWSMATGPISPWWAVALLGVFVALIATLVALVWRRRRRSTVA